jgi:glycerol-3-phosphate dehydrogenase (NAD(P)+)
MKIIVLGAGAWGTALAVSACRNPQAQHQVTLWARDAAQTSSMEQLRENQRYLPGVALPPSLCWSNSMAVPLPWRGCAKGLKQV